MLGVAFGAVVLNVGLALSQPASVLPGSSFESGDGNLNVDNDGFNDWLAPPIQSAMNCGTNPPPGGVTNCGTDLSAAFDSATLDANDNSFGMGSKEDSPNPVPQVGSIPKNKNDLTRFYVSQEANVAGQFLYLAWERATNAGSADIDFEFNQSSTLINGTPQRTNGDMLITYQFGGSGTPTFSMLRWLTGAPGETNSNCFASGQTLPCWGDEVDLSTSGFANGAVNTAPVLDSTPPPAGTNGSLPAGGMIQTGNFGEAGINLTQALTNGSGSGLPPCTHFGYAFVKDRSSGASFDSALKDFIAPVNVNIATDCPESTLTKGVRDHSTNSTGDFTSTVDNANPGDTLDYQLTYDNVGSLQATQVVVKDALQAGQTYVANSCSVVGIAGASCAFDSSSNTLTATLGTVPINTKVTITFQTTLGSGSATVKNFGTVTDKEESGSVQSNTTTVTASAPPNISGDTKGVLDVSSGGTQFGPSVTAQPGDEIEYKLTFANSGGTAGVVTATDVLQPHQTFVAGSCQGATCAFDSSTNTLTATLPSIAANSSGSFTFEVTLDNTYASDTTDITNTASCSVSPGTTCVSSNQTDVTVKAAPNLGTPSKMVHDETTGPAGFSGSVTANPGDKLQYQLKYTNTGSSPATGVTFSDQLDPNTTFVSGSCQGATSCSATAGGLVTGTIGTIQPGDTATVTFEVTVSTTLTQDQTTIDNTATCQSTDPSTCPDSTTTTVTVNGGPDLGTPSKMVRDLTTGPAGFSGSVTANPGDVLQYQLQYTNSGSAPATGVAFSDQLDPNTTFVSGSCQGASSCSATAGGLVTGSIGTIQPGATATVTFDVTVAPTFGTDATTIDNTASCQSTDPKTCPGSTTTTVTVNAAPKLGQPVKSVLNVTAGGTAFTSSVTAAPGNTLEYQLQYTNSGSGPATGVAFSDTLDPNTTFVDGSCQGATSCSVSGGVVSGTIGTIQPGTTATVTFEVKLVSTFSQDQTIVNNTASCTTTSPNTTCANSSQTTVTVNATPDLGTPTKSVLDVTAGGKSFSGSVTATPGDTLEYQLQYANTGSGPATGVTFSDQLDPATTFISGSCQGATSCSATAGGLVTGTIGTINPGDTATITFEVKLASTFPQDVNTIHNTATCSTTSPGAMCSTSTTTTTTVNASPNLTLVKSTTAAGVQVTGNNITYTLAYRNTGTADAHSVVISEPMPAGTQLVSCTGGCTPGTPGSAATQTWAIGTVPTGGSGSVTMTVEVTNSAGCSVVNMATIASPDENSGAVIDSNQVTLASQPGPNPAGAHANGDAYAAHLQVQLLGINQTIGSSSSTQTGVGQTEQTAPNSLNLAIPSIAPILSASLLDSSSNSNVQNTPAAADQTSEGYAAKVAVTVAGLPIVSASAVDAVAHTTATGSTATYSSAGSSIAGLTVLGVPVTVKPNLTIDLSSLNALIGAGSYVTIDAENGTTSGPGTGVKAGGTYSSDLTVTMISVHISNLLGSGPVDVTIGKAVAHSDFPQQTVCSAVPTQTVSGDAEIATEDTAPPIAPVVEGAVFLQPFGGHAHQDLLAAQIPSNGTIVNVAAASSDTTGTLGATSSTSTSYAAVGTGIPPAKNKVPSVCVLQTSNSACIVSADLIQSEAGTTANGSGATSTDTGTQFVGLKVLGVPVALPIPPNTTLALPGIGEVILNEQVCDGGGVTFTHTCSGSTHSGMTVTAVHVVILQGALGLLPGVDIQVARAHSDATFAPGS